MLKKILVNALLEIRSIKVSFRLTGHLRFCSDSQQEFEDEGQAVGVDAFGDGVGGLLDRRAGVAHCHAEGGPAKHFDVVAAVAHRKCGRRRGAAALPDVLQRGGL